MWVLYQVAMNFQEVFSNFSVLPGQMLQQLEQRAPETRSGIARRRGLLTRNAQRRVILNSVRGTVWYAPPGMIDELFGRALLHDHAAIHEQDGGRPHRGQSASHG